jgi:hypothetical protein
VAQNTPSIGESWGLDHIGHVFPTLKKARQIYRDRLGFSLLPTGQFPSGVEADVIYFGTPAYLELLAIADWGKAKSAEPAQLLLRRLESGSGIVLYMANVSGIDRVAATLRERGVAVGEPEGRRLLRDGKEVPAAYRVLPVPGSAVPGPNGSFKLIEYQINTASERVRRMQERASKLEPDPRRPSGERHANTARRLSAVWVAVRNLTDAMRQYEALGFAPGAERRLRTLQARGREMACGIGQIVLWQPDSARSPLATLMERQGEGPFGFRVEVSRLVLAQRVVEEGTRQRVRVEDGGAGRFFLVPPQATEGAWIEFSERP